MIIDKEDDRFSEFQNIKRRFFALRNGAVADLLRKGGCPHKIIFGLTLPQLMEIAAGTRHDPELAERLWANDSTRESMLLAPMIWPREELEMNRAYELCGEVKSLEVADILCHKLLKYLPYSMELSRKALGDSDNELRRYSGIRLAANLQYTNPEETLELAQKAASNTSEWMPVKRVALAIIEEQNYLKAL